MTNVTLRVLLSAGVLLASVFFVTGATTGVWIAIAACWLVMATRVIQAEAHQREIVENLEKLRKLAKLNFPLSVNLDEL